MDITKFYLPGSGDSLRMSSGDSDISSSDQDSSSEEETEVDPGLVSGFVGSKSGEIYYGLVLEYIKYDIDLEDDVSLPWPKSENEIKKAIQRRGSPMLEWEASQYQKT